jgi:hypothetical protein
MVIVVMVMFIVGGVVVIFMGSCAITVCVLLAAPVLEVGLRSPEGLIGVVVDGFVRGSRVAWEEDDLMFPETYVPSLRFIITPI